MVVVRQISPSEDAVFAEGILLIGVRMALVTDTEVT